MKEETSSKQEEIETSLLESKISSLRIYEKPNTEVNHFGNYLLNHIEKEEKFRFQYEKQFKKLKGLINKQFEEGYNLNIR